MNKLVATAALTLGLITLAGPASAAAAAAAEGVPAMIAASQASVQAQVSAIDPAARKLTLKAADGRLAKTGAISVKGAEGRSFDLTVKDTAAMQGFQAGDQVEGSYLPVLAIDVVALPAKN